MNSMRRIKLMITTITLFVGLAAPGLATAPVMALQGQSDACNGLSQLGTQCDTSSSPSGQNAIANVVKDIINIISFIAGMVAVILIVVSGVRFITSGGDSQGAAGARNMLIYAIIGLAVVALSQAIVHFVLNAILNNTVEQSSPPPSS